MAAENNTVVIYFSDGQSYFPYEKTESLDNGGKMTIPVPPQYPIVHKIYTTGANQVSIDVQNGSESFKVLKSASTAFDVLTPINKRANGLLEITINQ